jgi:hypothetical protein
MKRPDATCTVYSPFPPNVVPYISVRGLDTADNVVHGGVIGGHPDIDSHGGDVASDHYGHGHYDIHEFFKSVGRLCECDDNQS